MSPVELGSWTLTPNPPFSLLLKGLWQGPPEGITVRVGPGLGGREGAHLVRSALRAGTAWQGLVSCAGSKETETGRREGRTLAAHSPPPTQAAGNKLCFGVPREPLYQRLSELKGTPEPTEPPHFTEVKTQGSESFSKELKATQHGKAEKDKKSPPLAASQWPSFSMATPELSPPSVSSPATALPLHFMKTSDLRTQHWLWKMALTWPCPPKVSSGLQRNQPQLQTEAEPQQQAPPTSP